jgi:hypothetical protein
MKTEETRTYPDEEVGRWQTYKTTMRTKPSVLNFAGGARLIPGLKENYYSALEEKAAPQNQNRAAIAAPVMFGINTI